MSPLHASELLDHLHADGLHSSLNHVYFPRKHESQKLASLANIESLPTLFELQSVDLLVTFEAVKGLQFAKFV